MKQLIIRRMTVADLICNIFYKVRFWMLRTLFPATLEAISPRDKKGWNITFEDDFDEISWSREKDKKWKVAHGWGEFHPDFPFSYDGPPELVKGTSCARFYVVYDPKTFPDDHRTGKPITIPFRKSLISTSHSFTQRYGRFECRCNIPFDRGAWPAFWLWGVTDEKYSEIDIFEMYGRLDGKSAGVQEINLHYGTSLKTPYKTMRSWKVRIANKEKISFFHEFAMEWSPEKIECFIDGIKIFRYSRRSVLEKWFASPLWLVQNHSIDPGYVSSEDKNYYSEYLVDYIRAYSKTKS